MSRANAHGGLLAARAAYMAEQLGWAGMAGIVSLAVAIAAATAAWVLLPQESRRLEEQQSELRRRVEASRQGLEAPAAAPSPEQWAAALPDAANALVFIEALQADALSKSLQIEAAEYRREVLVDGKVLRYRVTMPVRGTYPALRSWLEEMMYRFPTVALDELTVRRDAEGSANVIGRVHLSHYSRTER